MKQLDYPIHESAKGFSLVELMVALLISAIFVGIGVPGVLNWMDHSQTVATTNGVLGSLQYARSEAATQNMSMTWSIDNQDWSVTDADGNLVQTGRIEFPLVLNDYVFTPMGYLEIADASLDALCIEINSPQGRSRFIEIMRSGQASVVNECNQ
jgi:prepilin-type N-terminal cleavage/methylation domain-containing protein